MPDLIKTVVEKGIRIESNPRSNLAFNFINDYRNLRLDALAKKGIGITINPDDPSLWERGSLPEVLYDLALAHGDEFVKAVIPNAARFAFGIDGQQKQTLVEKLEKQFA